MLFSAAAQANVVSINCGFPQDENEYTGSFDYDLQELTVTEIFYVLYPYGGMFTIRGQVDELSTITIIKTITNNTGITWTGLGLGNTLGMGSGGYFVTGSFESTKLQTITCPGEDFMVEFSGPPPVLDGESLTIQFDFKFYSPGGFFNWLSQDPIPEPTTMVLLALGGLALIRKRRV